MKPSELLRAAKAKIQDPKNWCRGALALDRQGEETDCFASNACSWCAQGALQFEYGGIGVPDRPWVYLCAAANAIYGVSTSPVDVNDSLGHDAVMRMYDLAIERAERDEQ